MLALLFSSTAPRFFFNYFFLGRTKSPTLWFIIIIFVFYTVLTFQRALLMLLLHTKETVVFAAPCFGCFSRVTTSTWLISVFYSSAHWEVKPGHAPSHSFFYFIFFFWGGGGFGVKGWMCRGNQHTTSGGSTQHWHFEKSLSSNCDHVLTCFDKIKLHFFFVDFFFWVFFFLLKQMWSCVSFVLDGEWAPELKTEEPNQAKFRLHFLLAWMSIAKFDAIFAVWFLENFLVVFTLWEKPEYQEVMRH